MSDNIHFELLSIEDARRAFSQEVKALLRENPPRSSARAAKKDFLSSAEVQEELGISKATLARWRCRGLIPFSKIGNKLIYERSEIEKAVRTTSNRLNEEVGR